MNYEALRLLTLSPPQAIVAAIDVNSHSSGQEESNIAR